MSKSTKHNSKKSGSKSAKASGKTGKMKTASKGKPTPKAKKVVVKTPQKVVQKPQDLPGSIQAVSKAVQTPQQPKTSQNSAQSTGNPYRPGSSYFAAVEGLKSLGMGQMHPHDQIISAIKKVMGAEWTEFAAKKSKKGKTAEERAIQNVAVVARKDYGRPLRDVGYEVRFDGRKKSAGLFKL